MPLHIVEWVRLDCGHVVDLTESEQRGMFRAGIGGQRTTTCPKCDPKVARDRYVTQSSTVPLCDTVEGDIFGRKP